MPPAEVQSLAEALDTQPWPLQLFMPLQSFLAVLQSEDPLQLFTPVHLTDMVSAAFAVVAVVSAAPMENRAAAVLAMAKADLNWVCMMGPCEMKMRNIGQEVCSRCVHWGITLVCRI